MRQDQIDTFMVTNSKYFPSSKIYIIKERMMSLDTNTLSMVCSSVEFKDPTTYLLISIFTPLERFLLGDVGLGILKLLTCGGCGIWSIIDWFTVQDRTRAYNFNRIMPLLMSAQSTSVTEPAFNKSVQHTEQFQAQHEQQQYAQEKGQDVKFDRSSQKNDISDKETVSFRVAPDVNSVMAEETEEKLSQSDSMQSYQEQKGKLFADYANGLISMEEFNEKRAMIENLKPKGNQYQHQSNGSPRASSRTTLYILILILAASVGFYYYRQQGGLPFMSNATKPSASRTASAHNSTTEATPALEADDITNKNTPARQAEQPRQASVQPSRRVPAQTTPSRRSSTTTNVRWREFLREYEAWVDSYVALLNKSKSNPGDLSLLSDYMSMMLRMAEWSEKAEQMEDDLSDDPEASAEYLRTMSRILMKLNYVSF